MIQRVQTLYLALGAALPVGAMFLPDTLTAAIATQTPWLDWIRRGLTVGAAAVAVGTIFLYKYRARQHRAALTAQILALLLLLATAVGIYLGWTALPPVSAAGLAAAVAPALAYLLFAMARAAIGRDIALVRSVDRLR